MTTQGKLLFGVLAIIVLGLAYWGISPIFRTTVIDEALPSSEAPEGVAKEGTMAPEEPLDESMPEGAAPLGGAEVIFGEMPVEVVGTIGHPASGTVRIVEADGKRYLRYENFKTLNGPDIFVYLASDTEASDFVSLGRVKATEGNINYEIPEGTDLSKYRYALTWCRAFSVLFNSAELSATP